MGGKRILALMQDESLKCWNLEKILEAEQFGDLKPDDLTMNDLLDDMEEDNGEKESRSFSLVE
jgi:hypothetical protein